MTHSPNYTAQDRGTKVEYLVYYKGMDVTAAAKRSLAVAHFHSNPGDRIADMGMGSGETTFQQAFLNPQTTVIGVDINPKSIQFAQGKYAGLPNLQFRQGDIEEVIFLPNELLQGILNSSDLHHVHSFNGYDPEHVNNAIKNQVVQLDTGGIMVIRDFVRPQSGNGIIEFTSDAEAELFEKFAREARSLEKNPRDRGFFYEKVGDRTYRATWHDINEFVLRKDYLDHWEVELQEEYGYFSRDEFIRSFQENGLRINYMGPVWNPWIVRNRFAGKFRLYSEKGVEQDFLPTNFVIVGEKVSPGTPIRIREKMSQEIIPETQTFLQKSVYRDTKTGELWDLVSRPNMVYDTFPYFRENDRIKMVMRYGFPRPIINADPRGNPNIDQKMFAGYMIEPIATSVGIDSAQMATQAAINHIDPRFSYREPEIGLKYYASPGMLGESIQSRYHPIQKPEQIPSDFRVLDIQDVIKSAQAGGLPDVRMEIGAYELLRKNRLIPDSWIGDSLTVATRTVSVTPFTDLLSDSSEPNRFVMSDAESPGFLDMKRSVFAEYAPTSVSKMTVTHETILDFVLPKNVSTNVASTLPVCQDSLGNISVYIEKRNLPVPQIFEGSSGILTSFAYRLGKEIDTIGNLDTYVREKYTLPNDAYIDHLGEGYYTSMGVTPERVYPCIVSHADMQVESGGSWVELGDLFRNIQNLRDMQLISAVYRLTHALGKWGEYMQGV